TDDQVPLPGRDEAVETVEYSDGYGRLIQTRARAEDVRFGDPVFGGAVLPGQQNDSSASKRITGQVNGDPQHPNVVVTGLQVRDNKGRVVEQYEPFLATGWEFSAPATAQLGQRVINFYDPRGQVLSSIYPDGSEQRVVYGIPVDLTDPERFI